MRIDPPQTETESQGPFFRANMSLRYQGETVVSGPQQAASKKAAEQLAAQVLLELVSRRVSAADVVPVGEEDLSRLQSANPKGRLLERCAKKKWPAPQFEQHANPQGYQVRAVLDRDNEERTCSAWYLAATLKAAEQAAAEDMLKILRSGPASDQDDVSSGEPEQQGGESNAAMVLNELKQVGILQSFGYEVVNQDGPSHQPVFSIVAWATTPDGRTWRTAPVVCVIQEVGPAIRRRGPAGLARGTRDHAAIVASDLGAETRWRERSQVRLLYVFHTRIGPFYVGEQDGRFHPVYDDESLGSYAHAWQAAEDLVGGHTFSLSSGIDTVYPAVPLDPIRGAGTTLAGWIGHVLLQ